jgi:hypothetical protein
MYLDRAKQRFQDFNQVRGRAEQGSPCTSEQVQLLEDCLGLALPGAYREFLLWSGNGGGCFDKQPHHHDNRFRFADVFDGSNKIAAIEILKRNGYAEELPDDAIVFKVTDGGEFSFIRAGEGDNPPIHVFYSKLYDHRPQQLVWNDSQNLEEYRLKRIESLIMMYRML